MPPLVITILLPFIGAVLSVLLRGWPWAARCAALVVAGGTGAMLLAGAPIGDPTAAAIGVVIAITAFVAMLGERPRHLGVTGPIALVLLALSIGALGTAGPLRQVWLMGVMGAMALLMTRRGLERAEPLVVAGIVGWLVGTLALAVAALGTGVPAVGFHLVACAILLPLFPFHGAVVSTVTALRGTLPALLIVVLPLLGWHELSIVLPAVPSAVLPIIVGVAVVGAALSAVRAFVHTEFNRALAASGMVLLALFWVHVGTTSQVDAATGWYVSAVTLALSGLFLAGSYVDGRYGSQDLDRLRGLAGPMPRFAVLVGVLVMAAAGVPTLGVFAGFWAMVLTVPTAWALILTLTIWFLATLWIVGLMQRLLFETPRLTAPPRDLGWSEGVALGLVITLLGVSGLVYPEPAQTKSSTALAMFIRR
ncbi:proton-conducting transporter transmembrane domain-containing protein [Candidatus Nitrospira bockiana]